MHVDMPPEAIRRLDKRGTLAGANLAWMQRGVPPDDWPVEGIPAEVAEQQWNRHRFARYRTFLAGLGDYVDAAHEGATTKPTSGMRYAELADAAVDATWLPYRCGWSRRRRERVAEVGHQLFELDTEAMTATPPAGAVIGFAPHGRGSTLRSAASTRTRATSSPDSSRPL
jgi:hypothetical protein